MPHHRIELGEQAIREWVVANPAGAAVIMTHSVPLDRLCLETVLRAGGLPHLAVLGPVERTQKLLAAIGESGAIEAAALATLRSPAGIALGGEGAAAIALSIVAELEQTFARRIPTSRSDVAFRQ